MYLLYMGKDDADRIDGDNDEDSQRAGQDLNFQWVTQGVASNGQYSINDMKSLLQVRESGSKIHGWKQLPKSHHGPSLTPPGRLSWGFLTP